MTFDTRIDRFGTHCVKWDMMEALYGLSPERGLAMWVADMDFAPPPVVQKAVEKMADHGIYGYFGDESAYLAAIQWWMQNRHGWKVEADHIMTTHGLVNGTGLCLAAFTAPDEGVMLMTPVYHAFARTIRAAGRQVIECPLALIDGRYEMDFTAWDAQISQFNATGRARMLILCSPHNPGGRVWSEEELQQVAAFCQRHDLILVSDEIHHDLVFKGQKHHVMAKVAPQIEDRLVMMTAATKTFNIAGSHTGNVIIADPALRKTFTQTLSALGISPNSFGVHMVTAAYSPEGAAWVDELVSYIDENRRIFDEAMNAIPGVSSMSLESTYLSWVDFSGTGMAQAEFIDRVQNQAGIAANYGDSFGKGGETYLRFNLATPRAIVQEAAARLKEAFADLQ